MWPVLDTEIFGGLLVGDGYAPASAQVQSTVVASEDPLQFVPEELSRAVNRLSAGECMAYAVRLDTLPRVRLLTLTTLRYRLRQVRRTIEHGGAAIVGTFGVDPSLESAAFVYELHSAAALYADRCLRPKGRAAFIRRMAARLFGCDPTLGAVVLLARKR